MNSQIENRNSKIVIAGGGPAGSSIAIRLARLGFETILIERGLFPRQKLCGEFISPESLRHFDELGVLDEMLGAGGDRISETRFFESGGRSIVVPSRWFGNGEFALSLSRAEMDHQLLKRAQAVGVNVREGTSVTGVDTSDRQRIAGVKVKGPDGFVSDIDADIFVDATGRSRSLARLLEKQDQEAPVGAHKRRLVGFKAHLNSADLPRGVCEIYSFKGGYAGASHVESGLVNLCFLIKSAVVRSIGSDAEKVVEQVVLANKRASETLRYARAASPWLAVSIESFGTREPAPAANLFTIGDAASFIDPFTGSGMVMAFQSAEILANAITSNAESVESIHRQYVTDYQKTFAGRLRVCSILRKAAFMPNIATAVVSLLGLSQTTRRYLAHATRS